MLRLIDDGPRAVTGKKCPRIGGARAVAVDGELNKEAVYQITLPSTSVFGDVEGKKMQYLYKDGADYVFMDLDTYDQVYLAPNLVSDAAKFMKENTEVEVAMYGEKALSISLPNQVILKITQTDPGVRGDTGDPDEQVMRGGDVRDGSDGDPGGFVRWRCSQPF